jgi:hypothetical protein
MAGAIGWKLADRLAVGSNADEARIDFSFLNPPMLPPHSTAAPDRSTWAKPWVQLKFVTFQPHIFPRMLDRVSSDARAGDLVAVHDRNGHYAGAGETPGARRVPFQRAGGRGVL